MTIRYDFERPRGTRDFLPDQTTKRNFVEQVVRDVFERYGFQEIMTPTIEKFDLFALRSGDEIRSRMFVIKTTEGELVLRPELTAPVCRVICAGQTDPSTIPYKFYYVGPCFRWERPQEGRYREFWQAGLELMGTPNPEADAEVISVAAQTLEELGLKDFVINVGNISILRGFLEDNALDIDIQNKVVNDLDSTVSTVNKLLVYRSDLESGKDLDRNALEDLKDKLDALERFKSSERGRRKSGIPDNILSKLELDSERKYKLVRIVEQGISPLDEKDFFIELINEKIQELKYIQKIRWVYVGYQVEKEKELQTIRLPEQVADKFLEMIDLVGPRETVIANAKKIFQGSKKAMNGIMELEEILTLLDAYEVKKITVDISVARGLEFYTGMVFEINVPLLGAQKQVCGGGRYDKLVEEFGGPSTPATGFAFGFDRIILALERADVQFPSSTRTQVFVVPVSEDELEYATKVSQKLRSSKIRTEMDVMRRGVKKGLGFSKKLNIPFVVIVGPQEVKNDMVTLRDMKKEEQWTTTLDVAVTKLRP